MEEALSLLAPEAVEVETLPVFSEGPWHAGRGQGTPRTDGGCSPYLSPDLRLVPGMEAAVFSGAAPKAPDLLITGRLGDTCNRN